MDVLNYLLHFNLIRKQPGFVSGAGLAIGNNTIVFYQHFYMSICCS